MYVVCLSFYAIGGVLVDLIFFNRSRLADRLFMIYVSERGREFIVRYLLIIYFAIRVRVARDLANKAGNG